jgi:cytochrome c-type biogenesis protein CcmH/NrfG
VKKEQVAMLVGGFAFGVLVGFALAQVAGGTPQQPGGIESSRQRTTAPQAQTQAGAPMMKEIGKLREVLKLDPRNLQALTRMAHLYHDARMWPQAVEFYEQVIELVPENPDIMTDLGTCYGGMNRNEEAVAMFRRANEADPDHWPSLFNMVIIAGMNMHDFETAEAALARMEEIPAARDQVPQLRHALEQARAEHLN